jgi:hypothetical protein
MNLTTKGIHIQNSSNIFISNNITMFNQINVISDNNEEKESFLSNIN